MILVQRKIIDAMVDSFYKRIMTTERLGEWVFLNIGTGTGAILAFLQNDPVVQVLTWCGLATLMIYNAYRALNERHKYLEAKRRKNETKQSTKE